MREKAMIPANPESRTVAVKTQPLLVAPELKSAAESRLNLATNPDSGGRPTISKAQARKDSPKNTTGMGKDRKSTRLNSSHVAISYAVFCLKKQKHDLDVES